MQKTFRARIQERRDEAAGRPTMHFVPVKSLKCQDLQSLHRIRDRLVHNRTSLINHTEACSPGIVLSQGAKRLILACERARHRGQAHVPHRRGRVDLLRPGDVLTHAYSGAPNLGNQFTNIVQDGRLLPVALAAKQRGVMYAGHGGGGFDYTVAEPAIEQGCPPDTISVDIHVFSGNSPGMPYLPWVMSKFMGLGFALEDVVRIATATPAKVIDRAPKLGTRQVGAPADVSVLELLQGPVSFVDIRNNTRTGHAHLKPVHTVTAGVPFGRPYNAPFAVR